MELNWFSWVFISGDNSTTREMAKPFFSSPRPVTRTVSFECDFRCNGPTRRLPKSVLNDQHIKRFAYMPVLYTANRSGSVRQTSHTACESILLCTSRCTCGTLWVSVRALANANNIYNEDKLVYARRYERINKILFCRMARERWPDERFCKHLNLLFFVGLFWLLNTNNLNCMSRVCVRCVCVRCVCVRAFFALSQHLQHTTLLDDCFLSEWYYCVRACARCSLTYPRHRNFR